MIDLLFIYQSSSQLLNLSYILLLLIALRCSQYWCLRWKTWSPLPSKLSYRAANAYLFGPLGVGFRRAGQRDVQGCSINMARKHFVFQQLLRKALSFCLSSLRQLCDQELNSVDSWVDCLSSLGHIADFMEEISGGHNSCLSSVASFINWGF